MKIKDLKVGTWLLISFAFILSLVLIIGLVSYSQTDNLNKRIEVLYEHPLQVRRAIDTLKLDITTQRVHTRDLILEDDPQAQQDILALVALVQTDIERNFETIDELYLGPIEDIEEAYDAYIVWNSYRKENISLIILGEIDIVIESISSTGIEGIERDLLYLEIDDIDLYAQEKADELYSDSLQLHENMTTQLIIIVSSIFMITLIIGFWLYKNIINPIFNMNESVLAFQSGRMDSRVSYSSKNEFGVLASSINNMEENIQKNSILNEQTIKISAAMISENEMHNFFKVTLAAISEYLDSQIAAVYILSEDEMQYDHFVSIGTNRNARESFLSEELEGELGVVLSTRRLNHIKNVSDETRFIFNTVNGQFIPNEIITLPIISNSQIIAIISFATIANFTKENIRLLENITDGLTSRMESIFADNKVREFMIELEQKSIELTNQNTELEIQKEQLNEVSKLKTNFLSNMSHELRTPLNSVIALSGVLNRRLKNKIPDEEYSFLEIIGRNGRNLLNLINDILDISRIESGFEEILISAFNSNKLITEIVEEINQQAIDKNIKLIQKSKNINITINSDFNKCRHILQNIIGNAVKFTEKGSVTVLASLQDENLVVKVTDTGIGISSEFMENIFEEFKQVEGGAARKFGGTGLGLAIAKKYANLLGGTITVDSELGKGSEFTLIIPKNQTDNNHLDSKIDENQFNTKRMFGNAGNNIAEKTILLVEDNESAVIQIKDLVEGMGVKIITAIDGSKALDILKETVPDAIILDLMMPVINGFDVLERLRNNDSTAHVPVLILTAKHITKEDLKHLNRNNIHQLIQKGDIDRLKLQKTIFNMLFIERRKIELTIEKTKKTYRDSLILVVEDNPDNMITVKALLSGFGNVIEAVNGEEAIKMAKEHLPDLILMDIALPGISGIDAYIEIRKISELRKTQIVALTASAMKEEKEVILAEGFDGFISKPIIADEFFSVIGGILNDSRKD